MHLAMATGQVLDGATIRAMMLPRFLNADRLTGFGMPWENFVVGDYFMKTKSGSTAWFAVGLALRIWLLHDLRRRNRRIWFVHHDGDNICLICVFFFCLNFDFAAGS